MRKGWDAGRRKAKGRRWEIEMVRRWERLLAAKIQCNSVIICGEKKLKS
jgi:hypothetical protein